MKNVLRTALDNYAAALKQSYLNGYGNGKNAEEVQFNVEFDVGRKYIKVIVVNRNSRSSHSFIVIGDQGKFKDGDILKSASWKTPARNFARGNIFEGDFSTIHWAGL